MHEIVLGMLQGSETVKLVVAGTALVGLATVLYAGKRGLEGGRPSTLWWILGPTIMALVTGTGATTLAWSYAASLRGEAHRVKLEHVFTEGNGLHDAVGLAVSGGMATLTLALLAAFGAGLANWLGTDHFEWNVVSSIALGTITVAGATAVGIWSTTGAGRLAASTPALVYAPVLVFGGASCTLVAAVERTNGDGTSRYALLSVFNFVIAVCAASATVFVASILRALRPAHWFGTEVAPNVLSIGVGGIGDATWFGLPAAGVAGLVGIGTLVISVRKAPHRELVVPVLGLVAAAALAATCLGFGTHQVSCLAYATLP